METSHLFLEEETIKTRASECKHQHFVDNLFSLLNNTVICLPKYCHYLLEDSSNTVSLLVVGLAPSSQDSSSFNFFYLRQMNYLYNFASTCKYYYNSINPNTLSGRLYNLSKTPFGLGAIDVIVVEQPDGSYVSRI